MLEKKNNEKEEEEEEKEEKEEEAAKWWHICNSRIREVGTRGSEGQVHHSYRASSRPT